jgi:hypothetical protein
MAPYTEAVSYKDLAVTTKALKPALLELQRAVLLAD